MDYFDRNEYLNAWKIAAKETRIIRSCLTPLSPTQTTSLPYIFLTPSSLQSRTTVVRVGHVDVKRPLLFLPPHSPRFEGDGFDLCDTQTINLLLVRNVHFPSMNYVHSSQSLKVYDGTLDEALCFYKDELQMKEELKTALITGSEDFWQLSILIYVFSMANHSAEKDVVSLLQDIFGDED